MRNTQFNFFLHGFNKTILLLSICFLLSCTAAVPPVGSVTPVNCVCADDNGNSSTIKADSVRKAEAECTGKGTGYIVKKCDKLP